MASANHDANHLKLSRKIGDAVAAAATNGTVVTSAQRNDYLNRANTMIQLFFKRRGDAENHLGELVGVADITFSSAALPSDYSFDLRLYKIDASLARKNIICHWVAPSVIPMVLNREAQDYKNCYTIRGTTVETYIDFLLLSSGTGKFYYIKNDQRASAGDSADILVSSLWYDTIVDIAALYFFLDKGQIEFQKAEERMRELILAVVGK
jgi:hypothetical protein